MAHSGILYSLICIATIAISFLPCNAQSRLRNTIYVLDCTGSMQGFNGAPDIWVPTKNFLKAELYKEAKENENSKVTILPFQQKVLQPIHVDLNDIAWPRLEETLNSYLQQLTATNICDSWLEAEKYIDQSYNNYIVLMTDGHDNIGGVANESKRTALLGQILRNFCGKYQNTKGFYVELTDAATLPANIQSAIDVCNDLYKIDASNGIPSFGCISGDIVNINTRDLPTDIILGFSNSGTFTTDIINNNNKFVKFSIKDNQISQGQLIVHVESAFGDDIEVLNKAIGSTTSTASISLYSDDVIITNPDIEIRLHSTPLRTVDIPSVSSCIERVKPFLWVKGNGMDTIRWNLNPVFSSEAITDQSFTMFRLKTTTNAYNHAILYNGTSLTQDSTLIIRPDTEAIIEAVIPQDENDGTFSFTLHEINSHNLDRINGTRPSNITLSISGTVKTSMSTPEIICYIILGLIAIFMLIWFGFMRNQKYPKFKHATINIQSPYFASIRVNKKYRLIVLSPKRHQQSLWDKLWKGQILYHTNTAWPCDVEITPSGKNMRFRCPSMTLICEPSPLLTRSSSYKILNPADSSAKFEININ